MHSPTINKVVARFKEDQAKRRPVHGAATYTYMLDKQKKKEEAVEQRQEATSNPPQANPLGPTISKAAVFQKLSECNLRLDIPQTEEVQKEHQAFLTQCEEAPQPPTSLLQNSQQQAVESAIQDSPRREVTKESDTKKTSQHGNRIISKFHKSVQARQVVLMTEDIKLSSIFKSTMHPKAKMYLCKTGADLMKRLQDTRQSLDLLIIDLEKDAASKEGTFTSASITK